MKKTNKLSLSEEVHMSCYSTGTLENHLMKVETLRDFLNAVLAAHKPCDTCPVAEIDFPKGFFIRYSTDQDNPPLL